MDYIIRMIEELVDLQTKITSLNIFLNSDSKKRDLNKNKEKEELMYKQLSAMINYKNCLLQRIEREVGENYEKSSN